MTWVGALAFAWVIVSLKGWLFSDAEPNTKIQNLKPAYQKLSMGMSLQTVTSVIGCQGLATSSSKDEDGEFQSYQWRDRLNQHLKASFLNGKLVHWSIY